MANERYSRMDERATFGFLVNALDSKNSEDGDVGCVCPRSDAEDLSRGAQFIPGEVTMARRDGKKVNFVTNCGPNCWYWEMPDGTRIYHFDQSTYNRIGTANNRQLVKEKHGTYFKNGPGPCPQCGNVNTSGGIIKP